jgi:hypothetical protein
MAAIPSGCWVRRRRSDFRSPSKARRQRPVLLQVIAKKEPRAAVGLSSEGLEPGANRQARQIPPSRKPVAKLNPPTSNVSDLVVQPRRQL